MIPRVPFIQLRLDDDQIRSAPCWRIRKVGDHWTVLRIQPVRYTYYFPVAHAATFEDALLWICWRTGACNIDNSREPVLIDIPQEWF